MTKQYEYHRAYAAKNAVARKAHEACKYAIRMKRLVKQPCEQCGSSPAEAHHDDYSKPLEVRWLCRFHHIEFHLQERIRKGRRCIRGHLVEGDNAVAHAEGMRCKTCRLIHFERRRIRYHLKKQAGAPPMRYFIVMIDYGKRGMEAVVHPEDTRADILSMVREVIREDSALRLVHVKEIDGNYCEDVTEELTTEANAQALQAAE